MTSRIKIDKDFALRAAARRTVEANNEVGSENIGRALACASRWLEIADNLAEGEEFTGEFWRCFSTTANV